MYPMSHKSILQSYYIHIYLRNSLYIRKLVKLFRLETLSKHNMGSGLDIRCWTYIHKLLNWHKKKILQVRLR